MPEPWCKKALYKYSSFPFLPVIYVSAESERALTSKSDVASGDRRSDDDDDADERLAVSETSSELTEPVPSSSIAVGVSRASYHHTTQRQSVHRN